LIGQLCRRSAIGIDGFTQGGELFLRHRQVSGALIEKALLEIQSELRGVHFGIGGDPLICFGLQCVELFLGELEGLMNLGGFGIGVNGGVFHGPDVGHRHIECGVRVRLGFRIDRVKALQRFTRLGGGVGERLRFLIVRIFRQFVENRLTHLVHFRAGLFECPLGRLHRFVLLRVFHRASAGIGEIVCRNVVTQFLGGDFAAKGGGIGRGGDEILCQSVRIVARLTDLLAHFRVGAFLTCNGGGKVGFPAGGNIRGVSGLIELRRSR
jgi:hypothetical protein